MAAPAWLQQTTFSDATPFIGGRIRRDNRDGGFDDVAGKHWALESETHIAADEIKIAADLRRNRRRQQTMGDRSTSASTHVVCALILRESGERGNVGTRDFAPMNER
jgi:hypothetical protein